jgi:molybdate transport system substrate-binding protein
MSLRALLAGAVASTVCVAGCGAPATPTTVVVFAAASLDGAFTRLGRAFEAAHPGVSVRFSFDGSTTLVDQLSGGATADVLATADRPTMERAVGAGLVSGSPAPFASNVLTLIVPRGNPARVTGLDASLEGTKLVTCAVQVPCGAATRELARQVGVALHPVSEETKVTDVRTKVESGQADAGIVYATDARAAGGSVDEIPVAAAGVRNLYLAAVPASAGEPGLGREFIQLVLSDAGQQVLGSAGFGGV